MIAACGQMEANTLEQSSTVWPVVERLAQQASGANADLLVLPETTYPSYWLESPERYAQPDILRSEKALECFAAVAAKHQFWLVAGFVEERAGKLFNSAVVLDRTGRRVHIARKNFLWDCDNQWFAPGDSIAAFDSEFGRLGVLICADCRAPEIAATLVADGAQMLILPTAWVNASTVRRTYRNVHPEFLVRARAMEFGVPFICCSKSGREGDRLEYVGQSRIVSPEGRVLAVAPEAGEHLIAAEVSPARPRPVEIDSQTAEKLQKQPYRANSPGGKLVLNTRQNADDIEAGLQTVGARYASISATDLMSFIPTRIHAIDGAQIILARGRVSDDAFARARATENRVFVVVASTEVQTVIHPDGSILYRAAEPRASIEFDFADADSKHLTPKTDLWTQRRPACYRLQSGVAC